MTVPRRKKRQSRRVLLVLALMLVGSGAMRIAGGTGEDLARSLIAFAETPGGASAQSGAACGTEDEVAAILGTLRARSDALDHRESRLEGRLKALQVAEAEIERNLAALVEVEAALEATMARTDGAVDADIDRLTEVYQSMKPKEASALFEQMDPTFAAGFLARMAPESAAAVMAGMDPSAAYTISAIFAGRNTGVPRE